MRRSLGGLFVVGLLLLPLLALGQEPAAQVATTMPPELGWAVGLGVPPVVAMFFYTLGRVTDRLGKGVTINVVAGFNEETQALVKRGVKAVEDLAQRGP
jgi:hypothetical protein